VSWQINEISSKKGRGGETFVASRQDVETIVRRKQEWIYTKLEQKEMMLSPNRQKEYITGKGFYYLVKKYSLNLIDLEEDNGTVLSRRLRNGHFLIVRSAATDRHISSNGRPCHQRPGSAASLKPCMNSFIHLTTGQRFTSASAELFLTAGRLSLDLK